ncbi:unnamed protein product [Pedinophyceae sp. YPF-701]|nr:unnamed protein product [Pedinophyceae sp. YPF-701]
MQAQAPTLRASPAAPRAPTVRGVAARRPLGSARLPSTPVAPRPLSGPSAPMLPRLPAPAPRQPVAAPAAAGDATPVAKSGYEQLVEVLTTMFPVWVFLGAAIGIMKPSAVVWFSNDLFTYGLGFLMLSMGLTLTFDDFKQCAANPVPIAVGYLAQYCIKPLLGYAIASTLGLSPALATGLILVSCCPGGQASNVATFIAHGNVALSVLMTTASTIGAIIMTPLLTKLLAGTLVPVDAAGLALSTFQVVLVPTVAGVLLNEYAKPLVSKIRPILPLIGVALTTLLCASPVGQVAQVLKDSGGSLIGPVGLLHAFAFSMGYWLCKLLGFSETTSRTVSIETGMQSAALGFMLAMQHFSDPLVAVPSAVSVVFMALGGSGLAVFWRGKPIDPAAEAGKK